jgi:hypothetical protein
MHAANRYLMDQAGSQSSRARLRVPNGDVEWEPQTDIAHFHADVVGNFVDRLSNDVALCVERIVCRWVVLMFDGIHVVVLHVVGGIYPRRYCLTSSYADEDQKPGASACHPLIIKDDAVSISLAT